MTLELAAGLVLALASAAALNWGFFAQHAAASALPPLSLRRPLASLRLLFAHRGWLVGFLAGIGGWVVYVAALALAPLSLVQATSAGGIGLLALLVSRAEGGGLAPGERRGVGGSVLGLALLAASLPGSAAHGGSASPGAVGAWVAVSVAAAGLAAGPLGRVLAGGAGLGIAAGTCYSAGDVSTKAAVHGGTSLVFVPVLLACHCLGFAALQLGFQRGRALATAGLATLLTNALPIVAGTTLYGEGLGSLPALRLAAFACTVLGATLLARPSTEERGRSRNVARRAEGSTI
jgi:hypothetical protein